jgi:hypothetical protein
MAVCDLCVNSIALSCLLEVQERHSRCLYSATSYKAGERIQQWTLRAAVRPSLVDNLGLSPGMFASSGWSKQLSSISTEVQTLQERLRDIKLELTVYVTCDKSFTEEHKTLLSSITAPNHNVPVRKDIEHGAVQYRGRASPVGEEKVTDTKDVREVTRAASDEIQQSCRPDGTCCCRKNVDENATADSIAPCCCASPTKVVATTSLPDSRVSSARSSLKQKLLVHPSITIYSGRPKTKDIIRRLLEQALGESAVVVCGPQGLVSDVKQDVCSLSDERAVHKGTGAQGIYLHTESFSY